MAGSSPAMTARGAGCSDRAALQPPHPPLNVLFQSPQNAILAHPPALSISLTLRQPIISCALGQPFISVTLTPCLFLSSPRPLYFAHPRRTLYFHHPRATLYF